ncbi:MAG TPA: hypothetical protein VFE85_08955, partial [Woeseiaceae bacterium]|nr:hypothetical protein [Woeseiaceae bacterium]
RYVSASLSPTLAWELIVSDADPELPWSGSVSDADIFYDLEIYDAHRLVYFEEQIPGAQHTVAVELEPCKTYRWSVRPAYRYGNELRFGRWMRYPPPAEAGDTDTLPAPGKGIIGRAASVAPAYTQDFASLEVACRRR